MECYWLFFFVMSCFLLLVFPICEDYSDSKKENPHCPGNGTHFLYGSQWYDCRKLSSDENLQTLWDKSQFYGCCPAAKDCRVCHYMYSKTPESCPNATLVPESCPSATGDFSWTTILLIISFVVNVLLIGCLVYSNREKIRQRLWGNKDEPNARKKNFTEQPKEHYDSTVDTAAVRLWMKDPPDLTEEVEYNSNSSPVQSN